MPDLTSLLSTHFGHNQFRPGQEEVLNLSLAGKNALALFPTGGGKSLCYQLPALVLDGPVIVVSPLLALMKNQVDALLARGISASRLDSTLDEEELAVATRDIRDGLIRLVFLSPERLANPDTFALLKSQSPALIAIDEAHCFSEWGQSFRPDYRRLPGLIRQLKPRATLALTATAAPPVLRDISKGFKIPAAHRIRLSYARPNLHWHIHTAATTEEKNARLLMLIGQSATAPDPTIIYCSRQVTTETVAAFLKRQGLPARAFHAGLPADLRADLLDQFLSGSLPIIVATIAFGMGVDKPDVRQVIHYDIPRNPEGWLQEAGRAGRDGLPARTHVIAHQPDLIHHQNITHAAEPSPAAVERIIRSIFTGEKIIALSPYALTTSLDVSRQVLDTILTYLETDKILKHQDIIHRKVRITPTRPLPKKAHPILSLRGWIDLQEHTNDLSSLQKLYSNIKNAQIAGDIILHPSHQLHIYQVRKQPASLTQLVQRFTEHFATATKRELSRLETVRKILTSRRCIHRALLDHLGEKGSPACGRCSRCEKEPLKTKLPSMVPTITDEQLSQLRTLAHNPPPQLKTPLQLTRYLLGITSPATRTARLTRRDDFALLEGQPFQEILTLAHASLGM